MADWEHEEVALMGQITVEMRELLLTCTSASSVLLPSLESYSDPFIHMERNDIAEEGGHWIKACKRSWWHLHRLLEMQESKRMTLWR